MNNSLCDPPPKILPCPSQAHGPPSPREAHAGFLARQSAARMPTRYLCQLASAGCNDIDDRKSSRRTCITAGNVLGETCPLTTHQFFSILLSPHALHSNVSHGLAPAPSPKHSSHTHTHTPDDVIGKDIHSQLRFARTVGEPEENTGANLVTLRSPAGPEVTKSLFVFLIFLEHKMFNES